MEYVRCGDFAASHVDERRISEEARTNDVRLGAGVAGRAADTDTCSNMLRTSFIEAWGVGGWVWSFGVLLGGDGVGL